MDDGWKAALTNWVNRMSPAERNALWEIVLRYQAEHMSREEKDRIIRIMEESK